MIQHRVVLSNGHVLLIEEGRSRLAGTTLHIASEQEGFQGEVDYYVCEITPNGVLVFPNSGDAVNWLTQDLAVPDGVTGECVHCGAQLHREKGVWVDNSGGDVCGHGGGNEPHQDILDE